MELTVLMPCLNEAETVVACVRKAAAFLRENGIDGEVLLADNGSTDGSQRLAADAGARVVQVSEKGYGNALMGGIFAARGKYVIMGDADDSYDFTALMPFVEALRGGADLVMGNRFKGGIAPGAMRPLHRYLGNPVLSYIGRLFFRVKIGDFHCGLRGFCTDTMLALGLQATGMEFASEMVVKATLAGKQVVEVPTTLGPDGRSRPPHLRSWRDGWRHLRFLLLFSPRWLFLIPGIALLAIGLLIGAAVVPGPLSVGAVTFDVDTLVGASAMVVIGFQAVLFALFTMIYASAEGFLPEDRWAKRVLHVWSLERGLVCGAALGVAGLVGALVSISDWKIAGFGSLDPTHSLRLLVPSGTALVVSCQVILGTFFMSILGIRRTRHPAAGVLPGVDADMAGGPPAKAPKAGPAAQRAPIGAGTPLAAATPRQGGVPRGDEESSGQSAGASVAAALPPG